MTDRKSLKHRQAITHRPRDPRRDVRVRLAAPTAFRPRPFPVAPNGDRPKAPDFPGTFNIMSTLSTPPPWTVTLPHSVGEEILVGVGSTRSAAWASPQHSATSAASTSRDPLDRTSAPAHATEVDNDAPGSLDPITHAMVTRLAASTRCGFAYGYLALQAPSIAIRALGDTIAEPPALTFNTYVLADRVTGPPLRPQRDGGPVQAAH
jgi:hypothetical protein